MALSTVVLGTGGAENWSAQVLEHRISAVGEGCCNMEIEVRG